MASSCFQQRRRGFSFRDDYCEVIRDSSDDEYAQGTESTAGGFLLRRSPSLSDFGSFLLPPQSEEDIRKNRLTAVFDLDETLIYGRKGPLYVRPGIDKLFDFLKSKNVEVVIWTSSIHKYADAVISQIDQVNCVSHVIYRHRSWFKAAAAVADAGKERNSLKNLHLLGRDVANVIIFENTPDCLTGFEENGILVEDYDGGELEDFTLFAVVKLLRELLAKREAAEEEEAVSVQEFIKHCGRLQLRELPTDKGTLCHCYCLPSHDERDENCLPFPSLPPAAPRKAASQFIEESNMKAKAERHERHKVKGASPYRSALMKKEVAAARRRYEAQKITSH